MPRREASHYRERSIAIAFVIGGHLAVLLLLATRVAHERPSPPEDRLLLTFIEIPEDVIAAPPTGSPSPIPSPVRSNTLPIAGVDAAAPGESTAIAPGIDWYGDAASAASREVMKPDVHDFGFPKREPEPRAKREFGWDKTHTERVSALPEGGLLIRLNDNCAIIIAPLPLGGCSLGKRKARGDLFDEMKAPVETGDWK
jgi:hypothetical protein